MNETLFFHTAPNELNVLKKKSQCVCAESSRSSLLLTDTRLIIILLKDYFEVNCKETQALINPVLCIWKMGTLVRPVTFGCN